MGRESNGCEYFLLPFACMLHVRVQRTQKISKIKMTAGNRLNFFCITINLK